MSDELYCQELDDEQTRAGSDAPIGAARTDPFLCGRTDRVWVTVRSPAKVACPAEESHRLSCAAGAGHATLAGPLPVGQSAVRRYVILVGIQGEWRNWQTR